ncbi:MAG: substrate-binding domain-containing protein, partial [Pseudomonadota bacterium]
MRFIIIAIISLFIFESNIYAEDQIRIVGSSTVYPFSASVAEHFGKIGDYRTPIVEATGSGAGIKLFCEGVGKNFPDITNASRAMLPIEKEQCKKHSVDKIIEIKFGYDGITLANSLKGEQFKLSRKQIFLA